MSSFFLYTADKLAKVVEKSGTLQDYEPVIPKEELESLIANLSE